jgi:hypothetical protein
MNFNPPSTDDRIVVPLLGAGPGLYFDFATFNLQVPENISAPTTTPDHNAITPSATNENTNERILVLMRPLRFLVLLSSSMSDVTTHGRQDPTPFNDAWITFFLSGRLRRAAAARNGTGPVVLA